jgi:transposase
MSRKHKHGRSPPRSLSAAMGLALDELTAIVAKAQAALTAEESAKLEALIETFALLRTELQSKNVSIGRLKKMLFGTATEKTAAVLGEEPSAQRFAGEASEAWSVKEPAARRAGHGRNGAAAYSGARRVKIAHPRLLSGALCPGCHKGKVYPLAEPAQAVRISAMAPLSACVYERDRLRCNLCGEVYTAPAPAGVGEEKYDETAPSMVGMLKYGAGLPFNRIEQLQGGMGVPLPAATQWDLVKAAAPKLAAAHEELLRQAAQGELLHNDDTTMKVLELTREQRAAALAADAAQERTGSFTSGIISIVGGHRIVLFFTGVRHAGENLAAVLARRAAELPAPIQMCDGLASNTVGDFETLLSNCIAHARRKYAEVAEHFPAEVRFVLEQLREVYRTDADARTSRVSPEERLRLHQERSAPRMAALEQWMRRQFAEHLIEPNSALGEAICYMQKRWEALTLFLRVPGVPLDNNITEQALKRAILHRKNALFYKTLNGARVGDIFMSLIYTAELARVEPFEYLVALQHHAEQVRKSPSQWLPWNYRKTLAELEAGTGPPA